MAKTRESISVAMRFHIMRRDKFTCQYCGAKAPDTALHVEHIKPVVEGGTNDPENLCAACVRCNLGKGTKEAISDDERPMTQRERRIRAEHHALVRQISWPEWASWVPTRSPEVKILLLALAHHADAMAEYNVSYAELSRYTGLLPSDISRMLKGFEAIGLTIPDEMVGSTFCEDPDIDEFTAFGALHIDWDFQRGGVFKPPYSLSDYINPEQFSYVGNVH